MKRTVYSALISAAALLPFPLAAGLLYQEEFDGYGDYCAEFNEEARIGEYPPSLKAVEFTPKTPSFLRKTPFKLPDLANGTELRFRFRFPNTPDRKFELHLYFDNGKTQVLRIAEAGSAFKGAAASKPKAGWPEWQWNNAKLYFHANGTLEFFTVRDGLWWTEATAKAAGKKLVGFNIFAASPVHVDSFKARPVTDFIEQYEFPGRFAFPFNGRTRDTGKKRHASPDSLTVKGDVRTFQIQLKDGTKLRFENANGEFTELNFRSYGIEFTKKLRTPDPKTGAFVSGSEKMKLPDAGYRIQVREKVKQAEPAAQEERQEKSFQFAMRPTLQYRYLYPEAVRIARSWEMFSEGTQLINCRLVRNDRRDGFELWLDGKYLRDIRMNVTSVRIENGTFPDNGNDVVLNPRQAAPPVVIDIEAMKRPYGAFRGATFTALKPSIFTPAKPGCELNLALCRENQGSFALECDGYLQRSAFDAMPSSMHTRVPLNQYTEIRALCAVNPDAPADFIPVVTARLTRFRPGDGRSEAVLDVPVRLPQKPGDPLPSGVRLSEEWKLTKNDKNVPLYEVTFKLDIGAIQDVIFQDTRDRWYLDLEFLGDTNHKDNYYLSRHRAPSDELSSVGVFAACLEKSPVTFSAAPLRTAASYYPGEEAGMNISIVPRTKHGNFKLVCTVADLDGKVVQTVKRTVSDRPENPKIVFDAKEVGWYSVDLSLFKDGETEPLVRHRSSFLRLAPDTRKAGYESPFFVWNFNGAHGTPSNLEIIGDMLKRMGIRRTMPGKPENDPVAKKYGLTLGQFGYIHLRAKDPAGREKEAANAIRAQIANYPHCKYANIFHESGSGPFPMELLGEKTPIDEKQKKADEKRTADALFLAKMWRKYAPDVKLMVGNSGESVGLLAQLFREKYPRELIDVMGEETVGMTMPPERSVAYSNWQMRELARIYGYKNLMPDACFEWKSRVIRHFTPRLHAAMLVRDAVIALVWGQKTIGMPCVTEMANSYYNTIWGMGSYSRWPLAYPHPVAAAVANMTLQLDRAEFSRLVPTDSATVYCAEFKKDGAFVYALWTARGKLKVCLAAKNLTDFRLADTFGRGIVAPQVEAGVIEVELSEEPLFAGVNTPIEKVIAKTADRQYAKNAGEVREASAFNDADQVKIDAKQDRRIELDWKNPGFLSFRRPGNFLVRTAQDPVRGQCLEIELVKKGTCPDLTQEYAFLRLTEPVPVNGEPHTVGVWVKGNSSWGKIYFELTDAEGEVWLSAGSGGYGCTVYDWPEQAGINFDGWCRIEFPLTDKSPVKVFAPGENQFQWQHNGRGNGKIDFPVKFTAIGVSLPRRTLNLLEMQDASPVIRLNGLGASY